jgi:hypothetical protein
MCGGTWPPLSAEPTARTDKKILLDGAADLIEAPAAEIVSHAGQAAKSDCQEIPSEDEACVNSELQIGKSTGEWSSTNNCNTLTEAILKKCHKGKCPIPQRPIYIPPIAVP